MEKVFYLLLIFFLTISCERIVKSVPPLQEGQLTKVEIADLAAIPEAYGKLVGVTAHSIYEGWAQLWFVDENQTIRMVRIQFHTNQINEQVLVIPRQ